MHSRLANAVAAGVGILLTCSALSSHPAQAQDQPVSNSGIADKPVTIALDNVDVRDALKTLFSDAGANYTIDPAVKGTVTVSLHDISFRTALEAILKNAGSTVPLTYRVEKGTWMVVPRPDAKEPEPATDTITPEQTTPRTRVVRIHLNYADAYDIAAALGGSYLQSRLSQILMGYGGFGGYGGYGASHSTYGWGTGFGTFGGYGGYGGYGAYAVPHRNFTGSGEGFPAPW